MGEVGRVSGSSEKRDPLDVRLKIIASDVELHAADDEWREFLDQESVVTGFFCDPIVLSCAALLERGDCLILGEVMMADDMVAIVPLVCRRSAVPVRFGLWTLLRPSARIARLPDFDFPRKPSVDPCEAFSLVIAELRRQRHAVDLLVVDSVPQESEEHLGGVKVVNGQDSYLIRVSAALDTYFQELPANINRKVRRFEKQAEAGVKTTCYRTPSEMEELRLHLTAVWQKSWHASVGRQHVPEASYLRLLAERGWIRAYVLFVGDRPVASILGFQYRGTYHYEAPAYDQQWRSRSPGIVLLFYALQDLFKVDPPGKIDFGFGYGQYKQLFGTHLQRLGNVRVGISGRGKVLAGLQTSTDAAFKWSKSALEWTGLPRRIKQRLRRGK